MHKMAFHRARVMSIIDCVSHDGLDSQNEASDSDRQAWKELTSVRLCNDIAPALKAFRAEVFLPYSLPGKPMQPHIDWFLTFAIMPGALWLASAQP